MIFSGGGRGVLFFIFIIYVAFGFLVGDIVSDVKNIRGIVDASG